MLQSNHVCDTAGTTPGTRELGSVRLDLMWTLAVISDMHDSNHTCLVVTCPSCQCGGGGVVCLMRMKVVHNEVPTLLRRGGYLSQYVTSYVTDGDHTWSLKGQMTAV